MATTEMSVAYIWYLEHTIFCFWVRSAVDVFAAWAALSFSWTSLVFGVTTEVTVGVFVLTPAGEHWLVRSWHLSAKRSSDDLTPGRNAIKHTCQTQEPLPPWVKCGPPSHFMWPTGAKTVTEKLKKYSLGPAGVEGFWEAEGPTIAGLAQSSGFWGLEVLFKPLDRTWLFRGLCGTDDVEGVLLFWGLDGTAVLWLLLFCELELKVSTWLGISVWTVLLAAGVSIFLGLGKTPWVAEEDIRNNNIIISNTTDENTS